MDNFRFWLQRVIGAAVMAALDEIIFHQILAWHHFFDGSTPLVGLMSDGFLWSRASKTEIAS